MRSRKEEIIKVAARLFRKRGYNGTSMQNIADEIGIKPASIYNHINTKQELLHDLLMNIATQFTNGINDISHSSFGVEQKLERLIALHIRLTVDHTDAVALIAGEWVHLEKTNRMQYLKLRDEYETAFKDIIEEGKAVGKFVEIDTEIILFSTLSTLRWLYSWYSKNKKYNITELERQITICLIDGIKR